MAKVVKKNKKSRNGEKTKINNKIGEKQKVKGNKVITKVNKKPKKNIGEILKINKTEVEVMQKLPVTKTKKPKETKAKKVKVKKIKNIEQKPEINVDTNAVQLPPKRMSNDPTPKQVSSKNCHFNIVE